MHLLDSELKNKEQWEKAEISLPQFDRQAMKEETKKNPQWVHFGAGNIFRAFPAALQQKLLNEGIEKTGIIVAEGYDYEIIKKAYRPQDDLSLLVTLKANGTIEKTVIGSLAESLTVDRHDAADWNRLKEIFASNTLQMVSFTITEKGYSITSPDGAFRADVKADFEAGPENADSYIGKLAALCYWRYTQGAAPLALVSMDNCSHNGDKLFAAVDAYAKAWTENGKAEKGFLEYIENPAKVSFPWSMIDKITPRPDPAVKAMLEKDSIADLDPVITTKNTYVAPFVNAEECQYLIIEDAFPNGKLPLDQCGIIYTTRETVDKVEKMKVCTCLNPLHTSLAIYGCLLGYTLIAEEMKNPLLKKMVEVIGYQEGLPVVVNPGILDPKQFIDEVVNKRIPNPFMPDTPQRIATDTSQKLPIRFGETIKAYLQNPDLKVESLKIIPLVFAGWLRYLMAVDDQGNAFAPSADPLLDTVRPFVADFRLGGLPQDLSSLDSLLSDSKIWGVDLFEAGLADLVKDYFRQLCAGTGAVERTLEKALG